MERSLEELVAKEVDMLGFELIKLETVPRGRRKLLRLYIDHPERNVTIDDCVRVSKAIGFVLDGEDRVQGPYNLEVSSPGINRPLTKAEHFKRFVGKSSRVVYRSDGGGKETVIGKIVDSSDDRVTLNVGGETRRISMSNILKANLHGEQWEIQSTKPTRKRARKKGT